MLEEFKKMKLAEFTKQFIRETSGGWTGLGEVTPPSEDLIEFDPAKYLKFIEDLISEVESAIGEAPGSFKGGNADYLLGMEDGVEVALARVEINLNNPKE